MDNLYITHLLQSRHHLPLTDHQLRANLIKAVRAVEIFLQTAFQIFRCSRTFGARFVDGARTAGG